MYKKVSLISVVITPSNRCKLSKEQSARFTGLNEALGIDITHNSDRCIQKLNEVDAHDILKGSGPAILVAGNGTPAFLLNWLIPKVS